VQPGWPGVQARRWRHAAKRCGPAYHQRGDRGAVRCRPRGAAAAPPLHGGVAEYRVAGVDAAIDQPDPDGRAARGAAGTLRPLAPRRGAAFEGQGRASGVYMVEVVRSFRILGAQFFQFGRDINAGGHLQHDQRADPVQRLLAHHFHSRVPGQRQAGRARRPGQDLAPYHGFAARIGFQRIRVLAQQAPDLAQPQLAEVGDIGRAEQAFTAAVQGACVQRAHAVGQGQVQ
jgi:hypothetical protein